MQEKTDGASGHTTSLCDYLEDERYLTIISAACAYMPRRKKYRIVERIASFPRGQCRAHKKPRCTLCSTAKMQTDTPQRGYLRVTPAPCPVR